MKIIFTLIGVAALGIFLAAMFSDEISRAAVPTVGLVGYWNLNENTGTTAADSSGNNNTGVITSPLWVAGRTLSGLGLDVASYVDFSSPASLDNLPGMSISFWVKLKAQRNDGALITKTNNFLSSGWAMFFGNQWNPQKLRFLVQYPTQTLDVMTNNQLPLNIWSHVVLTWDGSTNAANAHFYLGGAEATYSIRQNAVGTRPDDSGFVLNAGAYGNSAASPSMDIDDIRIYNRALTQAEVLSLFDSGDTTPPVISAVAASNVTATAATITWTTNELSDTQVEYGTTPSLGSVTALDTTFVTSHSAALGGLLPSTTYYYMAKSKDGNSNLATSTVATFTTATPDTTPPVISAIAASGITTAAATVTWTTNEIADTQLSYGTTPSLGSVSTLNPTLQTSHSVSLSGLAQSTTYYYSVLSRDSSGNLTTSTVGTFATLAPAATSTSTSSVSDCTSQPIPGAGTLSSALAAAATGDVFCLKFGTYTETATVTVATSNVTVRCPTGTVIKQTAAGTDLLNVNASGFKMIGCTIDHNSGNGHGVRINTATGGGYNDILLERLTIQNWGTSAAGIIRVTGGARFTIRDLICLSCITTVVYAEPSTSVSLTDMVIEGSYLEYNAATNGAVTLFPSPGQGTIIGARIVDNTILGASGPCILTSSGGGQVLINTLIAGNDCRSVTAAQDAPYKLYQLQDSVVSGNRYSPGTVGFGTSGILLAGGSNNAVTGNTINVGGNIGAATGIGIELSDITNVSVTGNTIRNYGVSGVHPVGIALDTVGGNMSDITISGNTLHAAQSSTVVVSTCILALSFSAGSTIKRVVVTGNSCFGPGAGGAGSRGVLLRADGAGSSITDSIISGNTIYNFTNGIDIGSGVSGITIGPNEFSSNAKDYALAGSSINSWARRTNAITKIFGDFAGATTVKDVTIYTTSPRERVVSIVADVTTKFTGGAISAATMTCGKTAGGSEYLVSFDVFTASVTKGNADADLGTSINRANAIQGGDIPSLTTATPIQCRLTTTSAPTQALTQGSVTYYLITEPMF